MNITRRRAGLGVAALAAVGLGIASIVSSVRAEEREAPYDQEHHQRIRVLGETFGETLTVRRYFPNRVLGLWASSAERYRILQASGGRNLSIKGAEKEDIDEAKRLVEERCGEMIVNASRQERGRPFYASLQLVSPEGKMGCLEREG
jgi:hypothetical protein